MQRTAIQSSLLASVGYDAEKKVLEVEFLRKQNEQRRSIYRYTNVSEDKWKAMMAAKSIGSFFLVFIKPNHQFTRVEEPRAEEKETNGGETPPTPEAA